MFLGNLAIKEAIASQNIRISPFKEELLQVANYDLRLGQYIYLVNGDYHLVDLDKEEFTLKPGQFVLAHTEEFLGTVDAVGILSTVSTVARHGLDIHGSSSLLQPGWYNRITLELSNRNHTQSIKLSHQMIVATVSFAKLTGIGEKYKGRYSINNEKDWNPQMMLPKDIKIIP